MEMVGILKIQVGRLWVFSDFFCLSMGFESLFMWGLGCTEAEFLFIQFPKQLGVFFSHKNNEWGEGL
jgi:hypothetical protein